MLCQCFSSPCSCMVLKAAQRAQRRANRDENKRERKRLRKALVDDAPPRDAPRRAQRTMPRRAPADDAAAPRAPSPGRAAGGAPPADAQRSSEASSSQALPSQFGPTPPLSGPLRGARDSALGRVQSLRAVDADDPFARYLVSLHGEIAARPTMRLDDAGDPRSAPLTRFHEDDRGAHRGADSAGLRRSWDARV
ncbi:hypothetical protein JL722_2144 [Aureococcus anophagefferens]|nr:hypothetical protein JL722_2144 [Aureococcus anophagefferens]